MFHISYNQFTESSLFGKYKVYIMPGLKVMDVDKAKCVINTSTEVVYIYV